MERRWDKKVVLISGGLGDIALATALRFGKEGALIALADLLPETDAATKLEQLKQESIVFSYQQLDIRDDAAVSGWIDKVGKDWNRIDVSVINAATVTQRSILDITMAEWKAEMDVNLNGAFCLAQQAASYFVSRQIKGNIVFLGSWAAHAVHPNIPAYSVSKAALRMLCKCMALELADKQIRVNEIAPGYVNAGLSKKIWNQNPSLANEARLRVPTGQLIEAGEVADQIFWICNEANRHITGSCLLMDGGLSLLKP
jgi:glucose 1-dehydrogenase